LEPLAGEAEICTNESASYQYMPADGETEPPFDGDAAIVNWYCVPQFQVILEAASIVNVKLVEDPLAGALPVPLQPVATYRIPVPPLTGEETDAEIKLLALNHPLEGAGEPQPEFEPQTEPTDR